MTNFDMMYRDSAHGPTPNYNISCSGNQASAYGKILPKNTLTNFDMMYRDSVHGPTPNYNISCSWNQASVYGMWDGHPHQV